jgi:DNA-entry nuclease
MRRIIPSILIFALLVLAGAALYALPHPAPTPAADLPDVPAYDGAPYVELNGNVPDFAGEDLSGAPFEVYSALDDLGRCGAALACVTPETMPAEERGDIAAVRPSGWRNNVYDFIDRGYLYNRCHLLGYQLTGENDNPLNLITGTRYLNIEGMLPFENRVAAYVRTTGLPVLCRVTPIFQGENLVASGVQMEAMSVLDQGRDLSFNVYCYNVQPGVVIDYATGDNWAEQAA